MIVISRVLVSGKPFQASLMPGINTRVEHLTVESLGWALALVLSIILGYKRLAKNKNYSNFTHSIFKARPFQSTGKNSIKILNSRAQENERLNS